MATVTEIPTQPPAPAVNPAAERIWARVPQAYRDYDSGLGYPLLLYLDAVTRRLGEIHDTIDAITGRRPIGPATPEPWSLDDDTRQRWHDARRSRPSALGDPVQADAAWLDWLAQLVGARLRWTADEISRRDAVRYAYAGWRAGSAPSIEYAARSVLTGSRYARFERHARADDTPATVWDGVIVTRGSETPDPSAVLDIITRAGVKPAGMVLWHKPYEASWDVLEARRPTWDLWETDPQGVVTWDRLQETGLSYADVPGNLLVNSSFEDGATGWTAGPNTGQQIISGGIDALQSALLTAVAAGQISQLADAVAVTDTRDYKVSASVDPSVTRTARLRIDWTIGTTSTGADETLPAGQWTRISAILTAPADTTAAVSIEVDGLAADETVEIDAWDMREYTG